MKRTLSLLLTVATLVAMLSAFAVTPVAAADEARTPLKVDFVSYKAYDNTNTEYTTYDTTTLGNYLGNSLDKIFDPTNASRACPFLKSGHRIEVVGKFAEPTQITGMQLKPWVAKNLNGVVILLSEDGTNWVNALTYYNPNYSSVAAKTVVDAPIHATGTYNYVKVFKSGTIGDDILNKEKGAYLDLFFVAFYNEPQNKMNVVEAAYSKTLTAATTSNMEKIFDFDNTDLCKVNGNVKEPLVVGKFAHPTVISGVCMTFNSSGANTTTIEVSEDGVTWKSLGNIGYQWLNILGGALDNKGVAYLPLADATTAYSYVRIVRGQNYSNWNSYSFAFIGTEQEQNNGFGYQTKVESDKWALRLIAAADVLDYDKVGFEITATGEDVTDKAWDEATDVVYTAVYEEIPEAAEPIAREASYFNGEYLYTAVITGISIADYADITFTVKPYVIRDGVKLYSATQVIVINDGVAVNA